MSKIRIIKTCKGNWYRKGQEFLVRDECKYQPHGVQVWRENMPKDRKVPDVVQNGHFEYVH